MYFLTGMWPDRVVRCQWDQSKTAGQIIYTVYIHTYMKRSCKVLITDLIDLKTKNRSFVKKKFFERQECGDETVTPWKAGADVCSLVSWTIFLTKLQRLNFWMDVLYCTRHLSLISLLSVRIEACRLLNYLSIQCHLFVPQVGVTRACNQSQLK